MPPTATGTGDCTVEAPKRYLAHATKRVVDILVAMIALVALSPLMALVALAVRLASGRPVIFRQERAGRRGVPFTIYKFRTMAADAEERKAHVEHLNEMCGPVFKSGRDPRVTPLGRVLRRLSLDELPQLVNVIRGDMSLVGPRPLPLDEARACTPEQRRREAMRPGLVCLWQVRGRSQITSFDEWAGLDLEYVDNWSLWLDFKVLVAAIPAVLSGRGAR